jgi:Xaa-Pro aminopeptidase
MFEALFQTFEESGERGTSAGRVAALRAELKRRGFDGFIVPRADRHQGEYVPPSDERLAWLTGFSGSAGAAVVLADKAVIFVDGRYVLQVRDQIDTNIVAVEHLVDNPPDKWLEANLPKGAKFAYDPWLHTPDGAERLAKACTAAGATLVPAEPNPLDSVWVDRPAPPLGAVVIHDLKFAGESAAEKIARAQAEIGELKADAVVLSDPHNVAWIFNIRGADVSHTPLPLAFATMPKDGRPSL